MFPKGKEKTYTEYDSASLLVVLRKLLLKKFQARSNNQKIRLEVEAYIHTKVHRRVVATINSSQSQQT